jgi:hypothetical protein
VRDAQAEAITDWRIPDMGKLARLAVITQPTLVANGSHDIMVPTVNSYLLAGHLPNAELIIYPDANHGFLFQYPHEFGIRSQQVPYGCSRAMRMPLQLAKFPNSHFQQNAQVVINPCSSNLRCYGRNRQGVLSSYLFASRVRKASESDGSTRAGERARPN